MRVIGGKYRGKKLESPRDGKVRPTTDMVRENVFNIIQGRIAGANFLDLFGGTGAVGIEALSRGAASVTFADAARESAELIRRNLQSVGIEAAVLSADYRSAIGRLRGKAFDIVYVDAPYDMAVIDDVLTLMKEAGIITDGGIVIYESLSKTNQKSAVNGYNLIKSRAYGSVTIDIYEKNAQ